MSLREKIRTKLMNSQISFEEEEWIGYPVKFKDIRSFVERFSTSNKLDPDEVDVTILNNEGIQLRGSRAYRPDELEKYVEFFSRKPFTEQNHG